MRTASEASLTSQHLDPRTALVPLSHCYGPVSQKKSDSLIGFTNSEGFRGPGAVSLLTLRTHSKAHEASQDGNAFIFWQKKETCMEMLPCQIHYNM